MSLFLSKVPGCNPTILLRRDSGAGILRWILWHFLQSFLTTFYRTPENECFFKAKMSSGKKAIVRERLISLKQKLLWKKQSWSGSQEYLVKYKQMRTYKECIIIRNVLKIGLTYPDNCINFDFSGKQKLSFSLLPCKYTG